MNKRLSTLFFTLKKIAYKPDFSIIENSEIFIKLKQRLERHYMSDSESGIEKQRDLYSEFMDLNSLKFIEWDPIKELGTGAYGTAFLMSDGRVLKITNNYNENEAKKILQDGPFQGSILNSGIGQPLVYETGKLDFPDGLDEKNYYIGYSITEKLNTNIYNKDKNKFERINDGYSDVFVIVSETENYINWFMSTREDNNKNITTKERLNILTDKALLYLDSIDKLNLIEKVKKQYELHDDFFRELVKTILQNKLEGRHDMHTGNVGLRNGLFVFFDF